MTEEAICEWFEGDDWQYDSGWSKVQPLIRCKDCKYWQKSSINYNEYVCYWGGYAKQEDDFCSWAVRKE